MVKIQAERLPDLQVPRGGHNIFYANGELTVVGGHTNGFVLTQTAEYFADGEWHLMNTAYNHDLGMAVPLDSNQVLLAGGCEKNLGIGQSFEVEMYDARHHQFTGFGCLYEKRTMPTGARMTDSSVVISGNWYLKTDSGSIERFNGSNNSFSFVKHTTQQRSRPYVLPISKTDALIFSSINDHGRLFDTIMVDRLEGPSFRVPLLEKYHPIHFEDGLSYSDFFIGDEQQGVFSYLLTGIDKEGKMALILVNDTTFQLLPTASAIPTEGFKGETIYYGLVKVDSKRHRAYVNAIGVDSISQYQPVIRQERSIRHYLLAIDYARQPATLTLYYTDPIDGGFQSILTPDGDVLLVGGAITNNFAPSAAVWRLSPNGLTAATDNTPQPPYLWLLAIGLLLLVLAAGFLLFWYRRRRKMQTTFPPLAASPETDKANPDELLMQRLHQLMADDLSYLKPDLRLQDVASALNVNIRHVSDCIKSQLNTSFANFINTYRINHAKKLMRSNPDIKINTVWETSGFANETSFFRTFKAATGLTPKEWLNQENL